MLDEKTKAFWIKDALCKATPVARRWAVERMKNGEKFEDFEDDFLDVVSVEDRLYAQMKATLCHHIHLHGLDSLSQKFFDEFVAVKFYNRNVYAKILKKVRKAFVKDGDNRYLEYLISKINEYIVKVKKLNDISFKMLNEGKEPDLELWGDKAALNDSIFEENKQFLKQTLNHLNAMERNRCTLGTAEIRMLLYHKDGCRREKLYRQTESWIIKIYNDLPDEDMRRSVYREICEFVADLVPSAGYISPSMINFIFDRDFLSAASRDLLVNIKPVITNLGMTALIIRPLLDLYSIAAEHIRNEEYASESDEYVMEIMYLYAPKHLDADVELKWKIILERRKKAKEMIASV